MRSAEVEHVTVQQRQVGGDHESEVFAVLEVQPFGLVDHLSDQLEVQQRFPALKFDLQLMGRRLERESQGTTGRLGRHVEATLVGTLPGYLAVRTRVLTPQ